MTASSRCHRRSRSTAPRAGTDPRVRTTTVSRRPPAGREWPGMRRWQLKPLPALLVGCTAMAEAAAVVLSWGLEPRYDTLLYAVYSVTLAGAGALIASRRPENAIGWLFCGFGLFNAVTTDVAQGHGLRAAEQGWAQASGSPRRAGCGAASA